jgi:RNA polymerase-associated protein CTR9
MSTDVLYIPCQNGDTIRLSVSDLTSSSSSLSGELPQLLALERAHPDLWLNVALAYFEHAETNAFEGILQEFTAEGVQYAYEQEHYAAGRVKIFNALAAWKSRKAATMLEGSEPSGKEFAEATDLYNRSSEIDQNESMTWLGKGVLLLLQGRLEEATAAFNSAAMSDTTKENVLVRLGLATVCVQRKAYAEALKHYKTALQINPNLPGYTRLGFAVCYYHLGDYNQCRLAFERVLSLSDDSENVHALLGLATLELNSWREKANRLELDARKIGVEPRVQAEKLQKGMKELEAEGGIERAFEYLQRAYKLDPTNPNALLLLSSHAFYTNDLRQSQEYAERVISYSSSALATPQCRGLAYYQLARSFHRQGKHARAFEAYETARKYMPHHPPTCLGYAQMLLSTRQETEQAITVLEEVLKAGLERSSAAGGKNAGQTGAGAGGKDKDAKQMADAASNNFEVLRLLGSLYSMPPSASALMTKAAAASAASAAGSGRRGAAKDAGKEILTLPDYEKSYYYLKKSVDLHFNSLELLMEFAEASARVQDWTQSYAAYRRTLKFMTEVYKVPSEGIPAEMLNNLGVVAQKLKKYTEAKEYYEWALRNKAMGGSDAMDLSGSTAAAAASSAPIPADKVTTHYNLGLLHSSTGNPARALDKMNQLLEQYPKYTDAMLYGGLVHQQAGEFEKAKELFDRALAVHSTAAASDNSNISAAAALQLPIVQSTLGNWHLAQGDIDHAGKAFDSILTKLGQVPSSSAAHRRGHYAKLQLGNLQMLKTVRKVRGIQMANPGVPMESSTMQQKLKDAKVDWREVAAFFENVLRADGKNLYAAHGLGCVLAQQGKYLEAKEMFQQVKDSMGTAAAAAGGVESEFEMSDVWCNLGHIYVQLGSFVSAVKMYQHCLKDFKDTRQLTTVQVLTYLARAHYLSDAFMDAKSVLQRALHLAPNSATLWYNLGLVSEAYAIDVFQKPPAFRSYREVESAIFELVQAVSVFKKLVATPLTKNEKQLYGDIGEKASRHAQFCSMSITNGHPHLAFAKQREEEQSRLFEESRSAKQKLDEELREKEEKEAAARQAAADAAAEQARENARRLEAMSSLWETVVNEEPASKKRSARQAQESGDEENEMVLGEGMAEDEIARRRAKVIKPKAPAAPKPKVKKEKRIRDESGSDSDEGAGGSGSKKPPAKRLKKKEKKPKGRSKYAPATGSDAEPDEAVKAERMRPKPPKEEETAYDREMKERKAKMMALVGNTEGDASAEDSKPKRKRGLKKETADESDQEETAAAEDAAGGEAMEVDQEGAGEEQQDDAAGGDDDDEGQQARKKSGSKKRRQKIESDEEEEAAAEEAPAADGDTAMAE